MSRESLETFPLTSMTDGTDGLLIRPGLHSIQMCKVALRYHMHDDNDKPQGVRGPASMGFSW